MVSCLVCPYGCSLRQKNNVRANSLTSSVVVENPEFVRGDHESNTGRTPDARVMGGGVAQQMKYARRPGYNLFADAQVP